MGKGESRKEKAEGEKRRAKSEKAESKITRVLLLMVARVKTSMYLYINK